MYHDMAEMEVQKAVEYYLRERGFVVCNCCERAKSSLDCSNCEYRDKGKQKGPSKAERGVDMVARKEDQIWVIEVKGDKKNSAAYSVTMAELLFDILEVSRFWGSGTEDR